MFSKDFFLWVVTSGEHKVKDLLCIFVFRVENILGKGENAGHQHFLLFPQCFQKDLFQGHYNLGLFVKGLTFPTMFSKGSFSGSLEPWIVC